MKLYNPFKWHIKTIGKGYVVTRRSYSLIHTIYMDKDATYTWSNATDYWRNYCVCSSLEEARELLNKAASYHIYVEG